MLIKWTDKDPETGERRFVSAERFAGVWSFRSKPQRRGSDEAELKPTLAIWEYLLDKMERRYRRREGVSDEDLEQVGKIIKEVRRKLELYGSPDDA